MDAKDLDGLRLRIAAFVAGAASFDDLEAAVRWLAPVLRDPCQRRPRDTAARCVGSHRSVQRCDCHCRRPAARPGSLLPTYRPLPCRRRDRVRSDPALAPRVCALIVQLSDELECHEEDARDLVFASASAAELPDDPYYFPALQHLSRARRLACYRRFAALRCVEELLELQRSPALAPDAAAAVAALVNECLVRRSREYVARLSLGARCPPPGCAAAV